MKNSFKAGLLVLVTVISFSACDPSKGKVNQATIDSPQKSIDTSKAAIDTVKKDTVKK
jgi:hypothetical protein